MSGQVVLRPVGGPPGSRLERLLGGGLGPIAPLRGEVGCFDRVVAAVDAPEEARAAAAEGLPVGAALPEAIAARLRSTSAEIRWGDPAILPDVPALLDYCRARGRSSIELLRAQPALLPGLQLGSWFDAPWRTRALRRARFAPRLLAALPRPSPRRLELAADLAFWSGVWELASPAEWRRLTASSYVVLLYHRFAGARKSGQERVDVAPTRLARQLRALRLAGFQPIEIGELVAFHAGEIEVLPARRLAITVDDGFADSVPVLRRQAGWHPLLFVSTAEVGGAAHWLDGEPVAEWQEIGELERAGVGIGSHLRTHRRLTDLDEPERAEELSGSLADLRSVLQSPLEAVAYPFGDHDPAACAAARRAGYRAGFTTAKGRNGAGTDRWCLKRLSVHADDGLLAILWKAHTGEGLPRLWLRARALRGYSPASRRSRS